MSPCPPMACSGGFIFRRVNSQAKLVRVVVGKVLDVILDIDPNSPTFKQLMVTELSAENKEQLFIPKGCAHGFVTLSKEAIFQ